MIRNFSDILGAAGFALAVAVCLLATVGASKAAAIRRREHQSERPLQRRVSTLNTRPEIKVCQEY